MKQTTPEPPTLAGMTDAMADRGGPIFGAKCSVCHGGRGEAQLSAYPDLNRLTVQTHAVFDSIVLHGRLKDSGMASFADVLTPADVSAIHAYLLREQRKLWREEQGKP